MLEACGTEVVSVRQAVVGGDSRGYGDRLYLLFDWTESESVI